ncbi:MAG: TIGR00730 family Rossman fold protein [Anaerolineae bacterium]|jgi:hypothetical protein|nr:TIGR00730 family Rossman fold protein [Anaerolineae bacterium]
MKRTIAVYGSARLAEEDPLYAESRTVGQMLAQAGYAVMTGGYAGVMSAASQGAAEAGGHVIGVTVRQLELIGERVVNPWVQQEIKYDTLRDRLHHLTHEPDGYVVMPGGVGTVQEVAEVWQLFRLRAIPPRPFILYGAFWQPLLTMLADTPYINAQELALVQQAFTLPEIIERLEVWWQAQAR